MSEESRLRELFQQMKDADLARAPSFDGVLRRRSPMRYWLPAAAMAVAALVAVLWRPAPPEPASDLMAWRSPTAFLLEPPAPGLFEEPLKFSVPQEVFLCESCF